MKKSLQRPSYVCTNCRRRKVKCDRKFPCTRCIRSKLQDSCTYNISIEEMKKLEFYNNDFNQLNEIELNDNTSATTNTINNEIIYGDNHGDKPKLTPNTLDYEKPYIKEESELFQYKTLNFKKPLFVKTGDSIKYYSPISIDTIFTNNKKYVKFRSMMPFLFSDDNLNSKFSDEICIQTSEEIRILTGTYTKQEIDNLMIKYISVNIDAILERLLYFENDLKNVITSMFLPFSNMEKILNQYFIKHENIYIYLPPSTNTENYRTIYAIFANILGIVQIVYLLTEFDESVNFKYNIINQSSVTEFGYAALKCMCFAEFKTRPTFELLLGFLIYRMKFYLMDSISISNNSMLIFNIVLEMAFNLGIHIRSDHINNYSEQMVRSAWNIIQFIDAISSVYLGEPLKIDYKYCIPNLYEYWEPIVLYLRNVVETFNSVDPISLNQIIDLANSASKLLYVFQPFDDLLSHGDYKPVQYIFSLIIKGDFIICYQLLLFILRLSLDEVDELNVKITNEDLKLIEDLKNKTECHLFYSLVMTFGLMKKIISGKISHNSQSTRLTISMRLLFSRFMTINNKLIF
ncbi:hap1 transcriptional regulatory prottein, partial [Pichia californica]